MMNDWSKMITRNSRLDSYWKSENTHLSKIGSGQEYKSMFAMKRGRLRPSTHHGDVDLTFVEARKNMIAILDQLLFTRMAQIGRLITEG